jgi:hypothetical protein
MANQSKRFTSQTQSWRDFNHETRLALHTLQGSLQLAKKEASPAQLEQLRIAEWCSTVVLRLLEAYASAGHGQQAAPGVSSTNTMAPVIGMSVQEAGDLDLPLIPVNEFEKFEKLMQTGQLLKIEEWSDDLGEVFPEFRNVADALGFYANSADLPSLQTVLERWRRNLA